jgi:WD40 repeat protein
MLNFNGECEVKLGASVLSCRHVFDNSSVTCVATLEGHIDAVLSVAFHPTASLLATGSVDSTVKFWR